jgi:hypothetical protein
LQRTPETHKSPYICILRYMGALHAKLKPVLRERNPKNAPMDLRYAPALLTDDKTDGTRRILSTIAGLAAARSVTCSGGSIS